MIARLRFAAFLSALAAVAAASPYRWAPLENAPVAEHRHDDIFFLNAATGWIVNVSGEIHKTTDSGASWALVHADSTVSFRSVAFADSLRGWAGALYAEDALFETFDGGETWSAVRLPETVKGVCGLSVVGDSVIYGVGTFFETSPLIVSRDRGATWNTISLREHATTLIDVRFHTPDSGFVTGGWDSAAAGVFQGLRAVILFTGDGGLTWERRHLADSLESWVWKLSFPTPATGYASMERFEKLQATVLKTTDSGRTWLAQPFPGASELQGIGFATPGIGWAGTRGASYATHDGGATWTPFSFGNGTDAVNRVRMLSDTLGFAVGKTVFRYSRAVSEGVLPGRAPRHALNPRLENRPDPFRGETLITFTLEAPAPATLTLYNLHGRPVRTLLKPSARPLRAGPHAVKLEASDLPPGPYVYRLRLGGETFARETMKLR